jgi:hypothetical protein
MYKGFIYFKKYALPQGENMKRKMRKRRKFKRKGRMGKYKRKVEIK